MQVLGLLTSSASRVKPRVSISTLHFLSQKNIEQTRILCYNFKIKFALNLRKIKFAFGEENGKAAKDLGNFHFAIGVGSLFHCNGVLLDHAGRQFNFQRGNRSDHARFRKGRVHRECDCWNRAFVVRNNVRAQSVRNGFRKIRRRFQIHYARALDCDHRHHADFLHRRFQVDHDFALAFGFG